MTDIGLALSLFSALAVLAVGLILGAGLWARGRTASQERGEFALGGGREPGGTPAWLTQQPDEYR